MTDDVLDVDSLLDPGGPPHERRLTEESPPARATSVSKKLSKVAEHLEPLARAVDHPAELLRHPTFTKGVEILSDSETSIETVLGYLDGDQPVIRYLALEALSRRAEEAPDGPAMVDSWRDRVLDHLETMDLVQAFFILRLLGRAEKPVVAPMLARAQAWWQIDAMVDFVRDFIEFRLKSGERPDFSRDLVPIDPDSIPMIRMVLSKLRPERRKCLLADLDVWEATYLNTGLLNTLGRVWTADRLSGAIVDHAVLRECAGELEKVLFDDPPQSVMLVGEPGVGKTTLVRFLARRLLARKWSVFEAGATEINAGQSFMGQLERRLVALRAQLNVKRRVIWYIPNFHQTVYAGRHLHSPVGLLEMTLPWFEDGDVRAIAEIEPHQHERLVRENRRAGTLFRTIRVPSLSDAAAVEVARERVRLRVSQGSRGSGDSAESRGSGGCGDSDVTSGVSDGVIEEALRLVRQHMTWRGAPGNLLEFLDAAEKDTRNPGAGAGEITDESLCLTLSKMTGLPKNLVDDREAFPLDALEDTLRKKVLGQPEAVNCLVERVAMIKSGLTDPERPYGVFLFAGPTGTGKTEIAKRLTECLFGSADRMIRMDMSELVTAQSLSRIVGEHGKPDNHSALVNLVRSQPFSVVLLDEFERAAPEIWDLFLQVFDDGRLTDWTGETVDFRHCIIILTSNLGSRGGFEASVGFDRTGADFSETEVRKAIATTFRPEFINRLDRIVVFRPLGKSTMRQILHKELDEALLRRGLRRRGWAVDFEESAIEFLLEKGFAPDLGARPLKRAIERYLLSPVARTIVARTCPEGGQFLVVSGVRGKIDVLPVEAQTPKGAAH